MDFPRQLALISSLSHKVARRFTSVTGKDVQENLCDICTFVADEDLNEKFPKTQQFYYREIAILKKDFYFLFLISSYHHKVGRPRYAKTGWVF